MHTWLGCYRTFLLRGLPNQNKYKHVKPRRHHPPKLRVSTSPADYLTDIGFSIQEWVSLDQFKSLAALTGRTAEMIETDEYRANLFVTDGRRSRRGVALRSHDIYVYIYASPTTYA
eukprot:GHVU01119048.1.p1 GENE.GHVU01119048.1~~GHVU01119048.1.p1  ORF type:complete len:116 (+),score=3.72 GHVU01119048.1:398-745(+)